MGLGLGSTAFTLYTSSPFSLRLDSSAAAGAASGAAAGAAAGAEASRSENSGGEGGADGTSRLIWSGLGAAGRERAPLSGSGVEMLEVVVVVMVVVVVVVVIVLAEAATGRAR